MPTTAGILPITAGTLGVFLGILFAGVIDRWVVDLTIILGTIAIVGGIYALTRKSWGPALAGSICARWYLVS